MPLHIYAIYCTLMRDMASRPCRDIFWAVFRISVAKPRSGVSDMIHSKWAVALLTVLTTLTRCFRSTRAPLETGPPASGNFPYLHFRATRWRQGGCWSGISVWIRISCRSVYRVNRLKAWSNEHCKSFDIVGACQELLYWYQLLLTSPYRDGAPNRHPRERFAASAPFPFASPSPPVAPKSTPLAGRLKNS